MIKLYRSLKLVKNFKGISTLVHTILWSIKALSNMFLLFIIFLVVFSIIGANIYEDINYADYSDNWVNVNEFFNLDSFYNAFLLNFRNSGESWPYIMKEYSRANPGLVQPYVAYIYFILNNFICFVVLVNLFLLIVLQEYFSFQSRGENPVEKFETLHETYTVKWNKYSDEDSQGYRISIVNFYKFLYELDWEYSLATKEGKLDLVSINDYLYGLNIKK